jgi:hypothetical protein
VLVDTNTTALNPLCINGIINPQIDYTLGKISSGRTLILWKK